MAPESHWFIADHEEIIPLFHHQFFFLYNIKIIFIQLYWKHTHLIIWWVSPTLSSLDQRFHISKGQAWIIILGFHNHCSYDNSQCCSFAGQINISRHHPSCDLLHFLLSELERQQADSLRWPKYNDRQFNLSTNKSLINLLKQELYSLFDFLSCLAKVGYDLLYDDRQGDSITIY